MNYVIKVTAKGHYMKLLCFTVGVGVEGGGGAFLDLGTKDGMLDA